MVAYSSGLGRAMRMAGLRIFWEVERGAVMTQNIGMSEGVVPAARCEPRMTILADHAAQSAEDLPDLLNLESRLAVVLDILRHCKTRCPITVAIYGDWGTGKTSAMRWLESQLREWNTLDSRDRFDHPYVYPVWFDPWRFQTREEVWRGIIAEVILALFRVETLRRENFVPQMIEAAKKFGTFLGKGFLHALAGLDIKIKAGVKETGAELGIKGEMFRGIYDEVDRTIRPEKAYLNQFEETLRSWIQSSIKGDRQQKYPARVALFIDDLDRCSPDVTLEVLEAIKLYLNIEPLIFVVALDRNIVDAIVRKHYVEKGLSPTKSEQYLDKIFQVEIQIAPSEQQMEEFLTSQITALDSATGHYWSKMLAPSHKQVLEKCIRRIAKENPREIKRLLNSSLLRGRAAADDRRLVNEERPQKLVFAQGVQFFLIQKIIRNKVSNATRLFLGRNSLQWFEALSAFVRQHPGVFQERMRRSHDEFAKETALRRHSVEVESKYKELVENRPKDDDGKSLDLVLLDDEMAWELLSIPFSMVVAQSGPNLVPPRPFGAELSSAQLAIAPQSADLLTRLPPTLRNRIARQLDRHVNEITVTDLLEIRELDLDFSQINSTDLEYLKEFTSLRDLSLSCAGVTDAGLEHLTNLTSLQRLFLGETGIASAARAMQPARC
jgi:KAP family P-loop domain